MIDAASTSELWSLFYRAWEEDCCPAVWAGYVWVDDDPDCPPYEKAVLRCTALDSLL